VRVAVVDFTSNTPFFSRALSDALEGEGRLSVELISPLFYPEPEYLANAQRAGWVVDLAIYGAGCRSARIPLRALEVLANLVLLCKAILRREYDVVHLQWIPADDKQTVMMRLLRRACDLSGCLLTLSVHNAVPHDTEDANLRTIGSNLRLAHLLIFHSENVQKQAEARLDAQNPSAMIPCPHVSVGDLPSKKEARARLREGNGPVVLLFGLIRPYKGLDLLHEAWPEVRNAYPDARLWVVGKPEGDIAEEHVKQIAVLPGVKLTDRYVTWREMLDFMAATDVAVFPYRDASQSGALMTAVSCGRPVVITPVEGLIEQTADLTSSSMAEDISGPALAAALNDALENRQLLGIRAEEDRRRLEASPIGWATAARTMAERYRRGLACRAGQGLQRQGQ